MFFKVVIVTEGNNKEMKVTEDQLLKLVPSFIVHLAKKKGHHTYPAVNAENGVTSTWQIYYQPN